MTARGRRQFNPLPEGNPIIWIVIVVVTAAFFVAIHEPTRSNLIKNLYQVDEATMHKHVEEGTRNRQLGFLVLGAMGSLVLLSPYRRQLTMNGGLAKLSVFLLFWLAISVTWAYEPSITFRRTIVIGMFCLGAMAAATTMSAREVVLLVFYSSLAYLVIGFVMELALGNFAPGGSTYRFSGTLHPNVQGINCCLLVLSAIAAVHTVDRGRAFFVIAGLVGFGFLVLTGSRTSLFSLLATLLVHGAVVYRRSKPMLFTASVSVVVVLTLFVIYQEWLLEAAEKVVLLGRGDQNIGGAKQLTGRLPLWIQLLEFASERPIQGYGYGSFFTVDHIQALTARQHWAIAECHNVFLEVLMGLGLVGMLTYAAIQITAILKSMFYFQHTRDQSYMLFANSLTLGVISGMAESTLLVPTQQTFVQFAVIAVLAFQPPPLAVQQYLDREELGKHRKPIDGYTGLRARPGVPGGLVR